MTDFATFAALLRDGGLVVVLAFVLFGGMKGWYVFGFVHADVRRERDENKALLLQALGVVRKAVDVVGRQP